MGFQELLFIYNVPTITELPLHVWKVVGYRGCRRRCVQTWVGKMSWDGSIWWNSTSCSVVIARSSTHNERLWQDFMLCFITSHGKLDPLNNIDLYCLPCISTRLDAFVESWNNNLLSNERNMTPSQLCQGSYGEGLLNLQFKFSCYFSRVNVPCIEFEA